uniref:Methyltransferase n=1 Tax=Haemonchus contortus TaxID=6289 RepID=A0A7I4YQA5_HAECO
MNVYRFGDDDDWRYSMLPLAGSEEKPCYAFIFVGFSHGLTVELQIKRSLLLDCPMIGVDPTNSDTAHEFSLNIGEVEQENLNSWNGMNERSLASLVAFSLELRQSHAAIIAEHVFVTDLDDVYSFLPYMLDDIGLAKYIVPCQLTVDLPYPHPRQLEVFVNFIRRVVDDERYTILSVLRVDDKTRIYLFNHSYKKCNTRYGVH